MISPQDLKLLTRAVELAPNGKQTVSPNPIVGAVIARNDEIIGEGWHSVLGGAHAEVAAIADCAGKDIVGATIYVSLEPCCHTGRTGPCTQAIIDAGLGRVVVASDDPSAKASGKGFEILRAAGIDVEQIDPSSELATTARRQNQPFRKLSKTGIPWVLQKTATSLDGRLATRTGDSKWISSEASRQLAHQWRTEVDAVAVGIGTALADDPLLTARVAGATRQPRRIVFDSEARLPLDSHLMKSLDQAPVTVIVSRAASRTATEALQASGAEVIVVSGQNEHCRVHAALVELGKRDISAIMLEGGSHLAGAFFDAGEIDELRMFVAPMLIGGTESPAILGGQGVERIADAVRPVQVNRTKIGEDLLVTAQLTDW